jgi:hypothetical protein
VLENIQTWLWGSGSRIESIAVGDVDADGSVEIVTGGYYFGGGAFSPYYAQLCVWGGGSLALENVKTWVWADSTYVYSVAVGDIGGDGNVEVVTGGTSFDGSRVVAQLCVWNDITLALENIEAWSWTDYTRIDSVAVGDVNMDGKAEIVTGGSYMDGSHAVAQLCVWA